MGISIKFSPHLLPLMDNPADRAFFEPGVHPKYEEDHHPPPKTDKLEREEQRSFANYCLLHGYSMIWHGTHKRSTGTEGSPDFAIWVNGKSLCIEFKRPGATLSPDQEEWRAKHEGQGCVYYVVYSHAEAIQLCKEADRLI
jgi:hypothetical protein